MGELDELETFVGQKQNKIWIWTVVDHFQPGIHGWVVGDRSAKTFQPLWQAVAFWQLSIHYLKFGDVPVPA